MNIDNISELAEKNTCKGLFFRCQNCYFESKGMYCQSIKFVPLKRKSCDGCEHCEFLKDDMKENVYKFICENPIHGETYQLKTTNHLINEEGYSEDWDTAFVLVENEL